MAKQSEADKLLPFIGFWVVVTFFLGRAALQGEQRRAGKAA